jgi:hypothetical protein
MPESYRKALTLALIICGDLTENKIKETRSFTDRTGHLRSSIKRARVNVREMFVQVFAGMEYGVYVNDGTRYIRARMFMEEGLKKASVKFDQIVRRQLDRLL